MERSWIASTDFALVTFVPTNDSCEKALGPPRSVYYSRRCSLALDHVTFTLYALLDSSVTCARLANFLQRSYIRSLQNPRNEAERVPSLYGQAIEAESARGMVTGTRGPAADKSVKVEEVTYMVPRETEVCETSLLHVEECPRPPAFYEHDGYTKDVPLTAIEEKELEWLEEEAARAALKASGPGGQKASPFAPEKKPAVLKPVRTKKVKTAVRFVVITTHNHHFLADLLQRTGQKDHIDLKPDGMRAFMVLAHVNLGQKRRDGSYTGGRGFRPVAECDNLRTFVDQLQFSLPELGEKRALDSAQRPWLPADLYVAALAREGKRLKKVCTGQKGEDLREDEDVPVTNPGAQGGETTLQTVDRSGLLSSPVLSPTSQMKIIAPPHDVRPSFGAMLGLQGTRLSQKMKTDEYLNIIGSKVMPLPTMEHQLYVYVNLVDYANARLMHLLGCKEENHANIVPTSHVVNALALRPKPEKRAQKEAPVPQRKRRRSPKAPGPQRKRRRRVQEPVPDGMKQLTLCFDKR